MGITVPIARVYDETPPESYRILVDRMWPRGIRKDSDAVDIWIKDVAPSTELRQWYGHDPDKASEFVRRFRTELAANTEAVRRLRAEITEHHGAVLVYAAKSSDNNASVIADFLAEH